MIAGILVILDADGQQTDEYVVEFGTELWEQTCEWARSYGLDPMLIPAESTIVADASRCQIRYDLCRTDADGQLVIDDNRPVIDALVEQLEGPPLPLGHPLTARKDTA